jgi:hypothetical protein
MHIYTRTFHSEALCYHHSPRGDSDPRAAYIEAPCEADRIVVENQLACRWKDQIWVGNHHKRQIKRRIKRLIKIRLLCIWTPTCSDCEAVVGDIHAPRVHLHNK